MPEIEGMGHGEKVKFQQTILLRLSCPVKKKNRKNI
jgi:hypothetical protein